MPCFSIAYHITNMIAVKQNTVCYKNCVNYVGIVTGSVGNEDDQALIAQRVCSS